VRRRPLRKSPQRIRQGVCGVSSAGRGGAEIEVIPLRSRDVFSALLALLLVVGASAIGQIATFPNLAPWYAGLAKPGFNPPNAIFGPVWTALYLLMAFAFWRILRLPAATPGRRLAMMLFLAQLALNVGWSLLFFGARSPLLGLLDIVPQWLLIVAAIVAFWRLDRLAALALAPLAAWVGFAGLLNVAIWRLN
jgi:benzodiazapine receptor